VPLEPVPPGSCARMKKCRATKTSRQFENGLQELEKIVKEMEGADLPLERALELFEKACA